MGNPSQARCPSIDPEAANYTRLPRGRPAERPFPEKYFGDFNFSRCDTYGRPRVHRTYHHDRLETSASIAVLFIRRGKISTRLNLSRNRRLGTDHHAGGFPDLHHQGST